MQLVFFTYIGSGFFPFKKLQLKVAYLGGCLYPALFLLMTYVIKNLLVIFNCANILQFS